VHYRPTFFNHAGKAIIIMKAYQNNSFQDRVTQAASAKEKALEQLRSRPPMDPDLVATRQAAAERRRAAEEMKREARKAAEQAVKDEKAAEAAKATFKLASINPERTEAERKADRDARYAARKNRK
jgi:hypothetical protein